MLRFFQRRYPSANTILIEDPAILVDPGDHAPELLAWLHGQGIRPTLAVTTHWHSDHVGAAHAVQAAGIPIAVSEAEADRINEWAPDVGRGAWLRQRITRYRADRTLAPGDTLPGGWTVLALPGHTREQIGLLHPATGVAILGDALHADDVGWLDLDADPAALDHAAATIEALDRLRLHRAFSGHGPPIDDVPAAIAAARSRIDAFRRAPQRIAWHACKRILTHALMIEGGVPRDELGPLLLASPWFRDHAARAFATTPEAFVPRLLAEMERSAAATWRGDRLMPATAFRPPY